MKRVALYLLLAVMFFVAVAVVWTYYKPHDSIRDQEPAFRVQASRLVQEFYADDEEASAKYAGKVLEVAGPVREVIRDHDLLIVVLGDHTSIAGVSCALQEQQLNGALEQGGWVTIKGVCNGMLVDVVMDRGVLLEKRPS